MNGYDVCRAMEQQALETLPILVLSAHRPQDLMAGPRPCLRLHDQAFSEAQPRARAPADAARPLRRRRESDKTWRCCPVAPASLFMTTTHSRSGQAVVQTLLEVWATARSQCHSRRQCSSGCGRADRDGHQNKVYELSCDAWRFPELVIELPYRWLGDRVPERVDARSALPTPSCATWPTCPPASASPRAS
jgi:hypothetical protein